jgi:hypothetical protein
MSEDKKYYRSIRLRSKEAQYIEQVAAQYDEKFLDAVYRIVNFHRDASLGKPQQIVNVTIPQVVKEQPIEEPEKEEFEMDFDVFS